MVTCETQEEIDHCWNGLSEGGGREEQCGWLTDRFGLSWQVVPAELGELMGRAPGPVMEATLWMVKIELERLREAVGGGRGWADTMDWSYWKGNPYACIKMIERLYSRQLSQVQELTKAGKAAKHVGPYELRERFMGQHKLNCNFKFGVKVVNSVKTFN